MTYGFACLQELFVDEFTSFRNESLKLKGFRLFNLYGLISSFVAIFLDSNYHITMSLDIISVVGALISLKMTRDWRLEAIPQKKRVSRFRLNAFAFVFHFVGLCLSSISFVFENRSGLILLVYFYHVIMAAFTLLLMFYNVCQIIYFKIYGEKTASAEQIHVKNELTCQISDVELSNISDVNEANHAVESETFVEVTNAKDDNKSAEDDNSAIALHHVLYAENNNDNKL